MDDFFADLLDLGSRKGGWRSPWAILGLLVGAGIGGYLGWIGGGFLAAAGSAATGAFLGWIVAVMFHGILRFVVVFAVCLAAVVAWSWLTGKL